MRPGIGIFTNKIYTIYIYIFLNWVDRHVSGPNKKYIYTCNIKSEY